VRGARTWINLCIVAADVPYLMPTFAHWFSRLLPVRSRRGLLVLILTLQAVILSVGLLVVFNDIRHRVAVRLQDRILEQNVKTAESLARTMDDLGFGVAYCGSVGRERAQKMIEELSLPAGGFVCLLDEDDKIICHPRLKQQPDLCGIDLRDLEVVLPDEETTTIGADRDTTVAGRTKFLDQGTHFLASKYIPSMKARILVQQPESGLLAFGEAVASGSMLRAAGLGAAALGLTGLVSYVLVRRHNLALETINVGLEREVDKRVRESLAARHSIILGLAKLAESRDTDTGEHLDRIASYAQILARQMAPTHPVITPAWIEDLRLASSLHDIGKVGVPDQVLLKPGRLTPEERAVIERHPGIGADTLLALRAKLGADELLIMSIDIARSHHEKWDGTGYPDRLAGERIPLSARVVALADVYDALTSERVYKAAMTHEQAAEIIRDGSGTHFDPEVVEAFVAVSEEFAAVRARLNAGPACAMQGTPAARPPVAEPVLRRAA
jgi:HD-GYP domain-containing protein (c-di-GMP phosphodiesterase class II)